MGQAGSLGRRPDTSARAAAGSRLRSVAIASRNAHPATLRLHIAAVMPPVIAGTAALGFRRDYRTGGSTDDRPGDSSAGPTGRSPSDDGTCGGSTRSEEHTSELQSLRHLVCRLLLEKK